GKGEPSIHIGGRANVLHCPVVEKSIPRTGVECEKFVALADPGHVGDATDIDEGDRTLAERGGERAMINGYERRPLPSRSYIGGAKVIDDGLIEPARQKWAVTKLHGQALLRAMENGLAVKADKVDLGISEATFRAE